MARAARSRVYVGSMAQAESLGVPKVDGVVSTVYDKRKKNIVAYLASHTVGESSRREGINFGAAPRRYVVVCKPMAGVPESHDGEIDEGTDVHAADDAAAKLFAEAHVCGQGQVEEIRERITRFREVKA